MNRIIIALTALTLCAAFSFGETIHVPGDYPTIQQGITAASNGDTVLVSAGTYFEQIDFQAHEIVLISEAGPASTVIDGDGTNPVVTIDSGEGPGTVIEGFTVRNGDGTNIYGGGIYCGTGTAPVIRSNIIENNGSYWNTGGGICALSSSPTIAGNNIRHNDAIYYGGGISLEDCNEALISNNTITDNFVSSGYGVSKGGGIYAKNSTATIERNLIRTNDTDVPFGYGGAGVCFEDNGEYTVINNTIVENIGNEYGTGLSGQTWQGAIVIEAYNNIIVNHTDGYGIYVDTDVTTTLDFNDVWNNFPENYIGCDPGPWDISEDPLFDAGSPTGFSLTMDSPCIDAGSFITDLDPDWTRTDIGAYYYDQENVNVALVPDEWPIVIPASGGSFSFTIHVTNHTPNVQTFDVWIDVRLPDGTTTDPLFIREDMNFSSGQHAERSLTQVVPGNAISGTYYYMAKTGDNSTGEIYHEARMPFTKTGDDGGGYGEWILNGWKDEELITLQSEQEISLSVKPNPFNTSTVISYHLYTAAHAELRIFDVAGKSVTVLVDRWQGAGSHYALFKGAGLPSGIYFAVLRNGRKIKIQKLIILK